MRVLILAALISLNCGASQPQEIIEGDLLGTWECGPTVIRGPNFELVMRSTTTRRTDHTFTTVTTLLTKPDGKTDFTTEDSSRGKWWLDGDVVAHDYEHTEFLSSSDPSIDKEFGQKVVDAQLKKKRLYQSRILFLDKTSLRMTPLNSMYEEAVVETRCKRVSAGDRVSLQ